MDTGYWKITYLIIARLLSIAAVEEDDAENAKDEFPRGHLLPLGSHMSPTLVERTSHLPSPREFHERYVVSKTPVVMEGALEGSPVWKKWQDDQYLRENFGEETVAIEEGKKENRSDPRYDMTLREFLDRYEEEDIYMVNDLPEPMYREWQVPRPLFCGGFVQHFMYTYIWFSSGGTKSVLHTDSYENLHCLVSGRKEFVLIEPHYATVIGPEHAKKGFFHLDVDRVDMTVYPELAQIPWWSATVHEGDCLYVPYLWIHNVNSFNRNMGINIWWMQFDFNEEDCPPDEQLPDYFPLSNVHLSPEIILKEVFDRTVKEDGSVHSEDMLNFIRETAAEPMSQSITLQHIKQLMDVLQPGCNGVIVNHKAISKENLQKGYEFAMTMLNDVSMDEVYDEEFGGHSEEEWDTLTDHMTEGGGDRRDHRDEL